MGRLGQGERRIGAMAGISLAAHLLALGAAMGWGAARAVSPAPARSDEVLVELGLEQDVDTAVEEEGSPGGSLSGADAAHAAERAPSSRVARVSGGEEGSVVDAAPGVPLSTEELLVAEGSAPDGVASRGPARPRLSLDQLGVGRAMFLPPGERAGAPAGRARIDASERIQTHLSQELTRQDVQKGLGPEGPVVSQVIAVAHSGTVPFNSRARLSISADEEGRITRIEVLSSDGAQADWEKLAREVQARLADKRLRTLGGRGYRFTLRVESRNQLPSGADPGMDISTLGIPIQKGQGPRSSSVRLLDPTTGSIVAVNGDLADLGQIARRVVHAHLEALHLSSGPRAADKP
ncbi:MAG TPA: hypothetical protein VLC09_05540 [Polyangiaceae bacterium]|nr:hypothetical protein [Polyangiaceae bacterium]